MQARTYKSRSHAKGNWRSLVQGLNGIAFLVMTGVTIYQLAHLQGGQAWAVATSWVIYSISSLVLACILEESK